MGQEEMRMIRREDILAGKTYSNGSEKRPLHRRKATIVKQVEYIDETKEKCYDII